MSNWDRMSFEVFVHLYDSLVLNASLCVENVDFLLECGCPNLKNFAESVYVLRNHLVDACCG
jgi:hypothetical protein